MSTFSGDNKPAFVRAMFERIAPRYDLMNAVMTFGQHQACRRAAARLARPSRECLALDLATGTGDFAAALLEVEPTCRVVGLDFALEMMRRGQTKYGARVQFVAGDMLCLPFPDNVFECSVNGFVLRNVADVRATFVEMYRVLAPGGRAVSLEITLPRLPVWRTVFALYFEHLVPRLGEWLSGDPQAYRYLPQSVRAFHTPEHIAALMGAVGFREVSWHRLMLGTMVVYCGIK